MNNSKEMVKYKESFISKIKNFFKKNFGKKEEKDYIYEVQASKKEHEKNEKQNDFISNMKIDSKIANTIIEKNNFLKEIEGNKAKLNMLSIERLKVLEKYYDDIIKENDEKIRKLKESN